MKDKKARVFSEELSRLLPTLMMEFSKKRMTGFTSGKISLPFATIIEFLNEKGACKMGELASVLDLSMGAVTGIVDKMIAADFVTRERSGEDRRIVLVQLTKNGDKTARLMTEERRKAIDEMFSVLTNKEKDDYLGLLSKVQNGIKEKNEKNK